MASSQISVNVIYSNRDSGATAPVIFPYGFQVASGYALTCMGGINVTGILTAVSYSGNGALLTNLAGITVGKTLALTTIL